MAQKTLRNGREVWISAWGKVIRWGKLICPTCGQKAYKQKKMAIHLSVCPGKEAVCGPLKIVSWFRKRREIPYLPQTRPTVVSGGLFLGK